MQLSRYWIKEKIICIKRKYRSLKNVTLLIFEMIDWLKDPSFCIIVLNINLLASVNNDLYILPFVFQEIRKCSHNNKRISSRNKSSYVLFLNLIVLLWYVHSHYRHAILVKFLETKTYILFYNGTRCFCCKFIYFAHRQ